MGLSKGHHQNDDDLSWASSLTNIPMMTYGKQNRNIKYIDKMKHLQTYTYLYIKKIEFRSKIETLSSLSD